MKKLILLILMVIYIPSYGQYTLDVISHVNEITTSLKKEGLIKEIKPNLYKAYVDEYYWKAFNVKIKEKMVMIMAMYCNINTETDAQYVRIYSWQTGKKIAQYKPLTGYKFY